MTEAEASRNQIQSDAKQMADELVAQYNRFQTEQDELKAGLEKEHGEQLRQASEQFEVEKNTLLENFSEKYQHLESENESKLSGMRFYPRVNHEIPWNIVFLKFSLSEVLVIKQLNCSRAARSGKTPLLTPLLRTFGNSQISNRLFKSYFLFS